MKCFVLAFCFSLFTICLKIWSNLRFLSFIELLKLLNHLAFHVLHFLYSTKLIFSQLSTSFAYRGSKQKCILFFVLILKYLIHISFRLLTFTIQIQVLMYCNKIESFCSHTFIHLFWEIFDYNWSFYSFRKWFSILRWWIL